MGSLLRDPLTNEALEERLGAGTTNLFRTIRYGIRRVARLLHWSAKRWAEWAIRAVAFLGLALLAPLLDRSLLAIWRKSGWRALRVPIVLGLAVYVRLFLDRRVPVVGKVLVAMAITYGVATRDLMPDAAFPVGAIDDVAAVILASRCFMLLCPERRVQIQAIQAARARDRLLAWHRSRMLPPIG